MKSRSVVERVLLVVGALTMAAAVLVAYVHHTLSDSQTFADSAERAYSSPEVRERMARAVVDQLVDAAPELVAVQPLVESVVDAVFRSEAATKIVNNGVADLHRTAIKGETDTLTVQLADMVLVVKTQLTALDPEVGALIPDELTDAIIDVGTEPMLVDVVQVVDGLDALAYLLPLISLVAFVASVWVADSAAGALVRVGLGMVVGALLAAVVEVVARAYVVRGDGDDQQVAEAVWDAFASDLGTWALVLAGIGAVVAAVAWFGVGETQDQRRVERAAALVRRRTDPRGRVLWGLAALVIGIALIAEWKRSLQFIVTVVGAGLVAAGIREVIAVAAPGLVEGASVSVSEPGGGADGEARERDAGRWLGTAVLVGIGGLALIAVWQTGAGRTDQADTSCNGSDALCARRLDEVVLAGTHNSHAAADDGFLLGYQRAGIAAQLDAGIRALLIDVYFGRQLDDLVTTDRAPLTQEERDQVVAEVGEGAVRSAEASAARAQEEGLERELFLCHALCEIGARPFLSELGTIKRWLSDNPRDVLVIIIQDEGPAPQDIAEAFEKSGLGKLLHAQPEDAPWPTLGELLEAGTPLVVFAENKSGGFDWYHDAFTYVQDTPFKFESIDDFTCEPNRGQPDSALFLVNHWLSPVSPTSAEKANAGEVLIERFEHCEAERGQLPNMLAVDFYGVGDLVETVAELNE